MRTLTLLAFAALAFMLFAWPAHATTEAWVRTPGGTEACDFLEHPEARSGLWGTVVCYFDAAQAISQSTVTDFLDTHMCENMDLLFVSEIADDTGYTNTLDPYRLTGTVVSATDLSATLIRDLTLTGDPDVSDVDLSGIYGFHATKFYARFATTVGASTSRISLSCHTRPR